VEKKIKVVVLMGGKTPEHEVSLISGREVVKNLAKEKFDILPVVISKNGENWELVDKKSFLMRAKDFSFGEKEGGWNFSDSRKLKGLEELKELCDVIFIAMHGPFGEDGTVQGMLELLGIVYTGPGVLSSSIGMDKVMFRKVMEAEGIVIPKYLVLRKGEKEVLERVEKKVGPPPYFVKPSNQGSSVGISRADNKKELKEAIGAAFLYSDVILVDEYVSGVELTCGVLGNEEPEALPIVEIIPKAKFFDYESKYENKGAEEIVPARISDELTKKVQEMAIGVYKALGCAGFSRVDFILKNKKEPVVLEINTIPGLTPSSLLPKSALAAGFSYSDLLEKIVRLALTKENV